MGSANRRITDYDVIRSYNRSEWFKLQDTPRCQLWKQKITNKIAQAYPLTDTSNFQNLNQYEFRHKLKENSSLVRVYHIAVEEGKQMCNNGQAIHILTEYIPMRLANVNHLSQEEALTTLHSIYAGFNEIKQFYGLVEPNQDLIGFNREGRTKVWINRNFSINSPEERAVNRQNKQQSAIKQAAFARKIYNMIENRTVNKVLFPKLKDVFRNANPNYAQAIQIIAQFSINNQTRKAFIPVDHLCLLQRQNEMLKEKAIMNNLQKGRPLVIQNYENKPVKSISQTHLPIITHGMQVNPTHIIPSQPYSQIRKVSSYTSLNKNIQVAPPSQNYINPSQPHTLPQGNNMGKPILIHGRIPSFQKPQNTTLILHNRPSQIVTTDRSFFGPQQIIHLSPRGGSPKISFRQPFYRSSLQVPTIIHPTNIIPQTLAQQNPMKKHEKRQSQTPIYNQSISESPKNTPSPKNTQQIKKMVDSQKVIIQQPQNHQNMRPEEIRQHFKQNQIVSQYTLRSIHQQSQQGLHPQSNDRPSINPLVDFMKQQPNQEKSIFFQSFAANQQNRLPSNFQSFAPIILQNQREVSQQQLPTARSVKIQSEQTVIIHPSDPQINDQQKFPHISQKETQAFPQLIQKETLQSKYDNTQNQEEDIQHEKQQDIQHEKQEGKEQGSDENAGVLYVHTHQPKQYLQGQKRYAMQFKNIPQLSKSIASVSIKEDNKTQKDGQDRIFSIQSKQERIKRIENSNDHFYVEYTAVESKVHILQKKENSQIHKSHSQSAFVNLQSQDIEKYIRNKYDGYIKEPNSFRSIQPYFGIEKIKNMVNVHHRTNSYEEIEKHQIIDEPIKRKPYERTKMVYNNISNITEKTQEDFLDVNYLEKSLDKKYNSKKLENEGKQILKKQPSLDEDDQLNIAKLEEGLQKFESAKSSKNISKQNEKPAAKNYTHQEKITKQEKNPINQQKEKVILIDYSIPLQNRFSFEKKFVKKEPTESSYKKKKNVTINDHVQYKEFEKISAESIKAPQTRSKIRAKDQKIKVGDRILQKYNKYVKKRDQSQKIKSKSSIKGSYPPIIPEMESYSPILKKKNTDLEQKESFITGFGQAWKFQSSNSALNTKRYAKKSNEKMLFDDKSEHKLSTLQPQKVSYDQLRSLLWN